MNNVKQLHNPYQQPVCDCATCKALNEARDKFNADNIAWVGRELEKRNAVELLKMLEDLPADTVIMKEQGQWVILNSLGRFKHEQLKTAVTSFIRLQQVRNANMKD